MIELIMATALAQAAPAPQWRSIYSYALGEISVDPASLRRNGTTFEIMVRDVFTAVQPGGLKSIVTLSAYDCARQTAARLHLRHFNADGAVLVDRPVTGYAGAHHPVIPASHDSVILRDYCPRPGATTQ